MKNRITRSQPDYILAIVRKPDGWLPARIDAAPPAGDIISFSYVASYAEAREDLVRCNKLSLQRGLDTWAVILSSKVDLWAQFG